ncbi:kinase-like domain-containing protein [Hyaloraphidium curvatum]|nr:kinase-like domain-containing protein [Hyaloraphidium curvatum]
MNELGFTKGSKFRIACREGNLAEARHFLADPSFDPNQVSDRSGLMVAAEKARLDIVLLLLGDARVDVNVTNDNGENAFMLACQEGHSPVVELLLKDGRTNFDKRNYLGRTGFWLACWYNRTSTIELLLSHGELVNPTIPSLRGKPPSQAGNAATRKLVEDAVNRMLKSFGSDEDEKLPERMTPAAVISKLRVSASDIDYDKTKKPLGEGGFGVVYSGTFKKYNRVAIKVLKDANPKAMKDFAAEIAVWDGLVQKNILPLMAFCEDPPMMVSELAVDGNMRESLTKLKWSLSTGLKYLVHVTHGMTFLHSNNIVHLDLKPPNVLIDNGIAKITDFGMSKVRQRVTTVAGNGYGGTHGYMAPEVYEGIMGRGADVYAFAMMLYEVVSQGKIPFRGGSALQVMNAVVNGVRPPRPNSVAVDERHWQLIEDCWHQERSKRPMFFEIRERMEPWLKEDPKTAVYSAQWSDR